MLFCLTAHMHLEKIQRYVHKNKQMKYLSNQVLYKRDYFSVVGVGGFQTFIPGITGSVISSVDFDLQLHSTSSKKRCKHLQDGVVFVVRIRFFFKTYEHRLYIYYFFIACYRTEQKRIRLMQTSTTAVSFFLFIIFDWGRSLFLFYD